MSFLFSSPVDNLQWWFVYGLIVINSSAVNFANYQGYLAQSLPDEFSEKFNIALAMASLMEGFVLGFSLLFAVQDEGGAYFIIRLLLVSVICFDLLLPIFIPVVTKKEEDCVVFKRVSIVVKYDSF